MSVPSKEISPLLGSYSLYTKGSKIKEKMEGVFYCKISPKKCEVAGPDPDNQHETVMHHTQKNHADAKLCSYYAFSIVEQVRS